MLRRIHEVSFAVFLSILFLMSYAGAQSVTGALSGQVRDSTGAVIRGATISVVEAATNVKRSTRSAADGYFNVPFLPPGSYRLQVEAIGFATSVQDNIAISVSAPVRLDPVLKLGPANATVEVQAAPPTLQTENAEVSIDFDSRQVTDLPLEYRNPQGLASLAAGVTPATGGVPAADDPAGTMYFNVNGQPNSANNTLVDGVDNLEPLDGVTIYIPSPEMIQEVHLSTSNYGSEFGRVAGAVVNITTRRGTNDIHGTLWEYNQNAAFEAKNYFSGTAPVPPLVHNDFGAVISGPILKNRLFFMGAYRGYRRNSSTVGTTTVPLPAFLGGDFSSVSGAAIYNPFTGKSTGTGRTQFAKNVIPSALISGPALIINKYFPAPTNNSIENNFVRNVPNSISRDTYTGRVDYSLSDSTKIFAETNISTDSIRAESVMPEPLGAGSATKGTTATSIIGLTHTFSSTLLNELRISYNLYSVYQRDLDDTLTNADAGIKDPNPYPISQQGLASMAMYVNVGGDYRVPFGDTDNLYQISDTVSKQLGTHFLKFGGVVQRNRMDRPQPQGLNGGPRGKFQFQPGTTELNGGNAGSYASYVNAFAAYLLGLPQQTSRTYMVGTPSNRQTQVQAFIADTWHVTSRLTLDLGLREEFYEAVRPKGKGGASNYDPTTNSLLVAGYGDNSLSNNIDNQSTVEPRIGITYRLDRNSVIRTGFAISGWTGRYGFTGGSLSSQFPVIYNVQEGVVSGYGYNGSINNLPAVPFITVPDSGLITPAPNQQFFVVPKRNPMTTIEAWNLSYQRSLPGNMNLTVGYVGNVARHLPGNVQLNVAAPGTGTAGLRYASFGRTAQTTLRANISSSNYHALQATLLRRFKDGFSFNVAYAYSKSLDVASNQGGYADNLDLSRQYGPSDFDSTHNLVLSHLYELPFGKGKRFLNHGGVASQVLSGWQVNGVLRLMSGTPFTVTADATTCNCPGNSQYGQKIASVKYLHGVGPGKPWFSTDSFAAPPANQFGNVGRNSLRGPDLKQYDASLFRSFHIGEIATLQARGEFFNITNTPRFNNPGSQVATGSFGIISGANANQRVGQIALKLLF